MAGGESQVKKMTFAEHFFLDKHFKYTILFNIHNNPVR